MLDLEREGRAYTCAELKDAVLTTIDPRKAEAEQQQRAEERSFRAMYLRQMNLQHGRTREIYRQTLLRLEDWDRVQTQRKWRLDTMQFEDMGVAWIEAFDAFLARTEGVNTRSIHLRNVRAVCNYAWRKAEVTTAYPFKNYTIRKEETRHRALTAEALADFFAFKIPDGEEWLEQYRDMAWFVFATCGTNIADLHGVRCLTGGRLDYKRRKTGRLYSIKVEPEAQWVIDKWGGTGEKLFAWAEAYQQERDFTKRLNDALQKVGPVTYTKDPVRGQPVKHWQPLQPEVTCYWMRHSWATIAYNDCDVPMDYIAESLGHGKKTVTDVYIDRDQRHIDEANRKVLDYVCNLLRKRCGGRLPWE